MDVYLSLSPILLVSELAEIRILEVCVCLPVIAVEKYLSVSNHGKKFVADTKLLSGVHHRRREGVLINMLGIV